MKFAVSFLIAISLGFLVGYQAERPESAPTVKDSQLEELMAFPRLPGNQPFLAESSSENIMSINSALDTEVNHEIPKGYGMYADFDHILSVMLEWPEKEDADYLYLGVGETEESVQRRPWGDIYSGYVTGKTEMTLSLPELWENDNLLDRVVYVRLWTKIGSKWTYEDFAFDVSHSSHNFCGDVVEPVCGVIHTESIYEEYSDVIREQTFMNLCELKKAGAEMLHWGICGGGNGNECTEEYQPVCGQRYPASCEAYLLEAHSDEGFEIPPKCQPIRETYSNSCELRNSGAEMLYWGECREQNLSIENKAQYMCKNSDKLGLTSYKSMQNFSAGEILECRDGYVKITPPESLPDAPTVLFDEYFNRVATCGGFPREGYIEPEICKTLQCMSTGIHLCDPPIPCKPDPYANPVCASVEECGVDSFGLSYACHEIQKTFDSRCEANKVGAKIIHRGECGDITLKEKVQYMCENAEIIGIEYLSADIGTSNPGAKILECAGGYTRLIPSENFPWHPNILFDKNFNKVAQCGGGNVAEELNNPEICSIDCIDTGYHLCEEKGRPEPECPSLYNPVCAVVGDYCVDDMCFPGQLKTFGNSCEANRVDARIIHYGSCEEEVCEEGYNPVCAIVYNEDPVDGMITPFQKTFSNRCLALQEGVEIIHGGECGEGEGNDGERGIPRQCTSWYDGCNTCSVRDGILGACTMRYCVQHDEPRCLDWKKNPLISNSCDDQLTVVGECEMEINAFEFDGESCVQASATGCEATTIPFVSKHQCEYKCEDNSSPTENCSSWYDGCNTCEVIDGDIVGCTEKKCSSRSIPRCLEYVEEEEEEMECENINERVCGVKNRRLTNYKNACELYKDEADMFAHDRCDNTYRARVFEFTDGENTFAFKISDPDTIVKARNILAGHETEEIHVTGIVETKPALEYDNRDWDFRMKPSSVRFFENGEQTCDTTIASLQDTLDEEGETELPANRWCPSTSELVREIPGEYKIN